MGKATWNSTVTVNVDDCINTGTTDAQGGGFCCFAGGPLSASSGANTLAMSFTGLLCEDPNAGIDRSRVDSSSLPARENL